MEKTINDILDEKRMWIDETAELRNRLDKAHRKHHELYKVWENSGDDILPLIEQNRELILEIEKMIDEYEYEIRANRKKLIDYIKSMDKPRRVKYAKPRLNKRFEGHPLESIAKEINEMIENRRVPGRNSIRKGRAKYVKINKVQD